MSTRALSSQRNKRTSQVATQPRPTQQQNLPKNNGNTRRELTVQEAFSLVNNKISNLEKAVFEGDFTRPASTKIEPKKEEIEDIYSKIQELSEKFESTSSNPYTSLNTATSFDTINAELLMMKNDIMSTRSATQKIDILQNDISTVKQQLSSLGNSNEVDFSNKFESIENKVNDIKDVIIKLQNFTLEINDMCLKHIKSNEYDPFEIMNKQFNEDTDNDNESSTQEPGIYIYDNDDEAPTLVVDNLNDNNDIKMVVNELEENGNQPEPQPIDQDEIPDEPQPIDQDEIPDEPQPISEDINEGCCQNNCENCDDCDDCKNCDNCKDCKSCFDCKDCIDCNNCEGCVGCENCTDCAGCVGLKNVTGAINKSAEDIQTEQTEKE